MSRPCARHTGALFDDEHYIYFGYLLLNDADVSAFATAYAAEIAGGGDFSGDLPGSTSYGDVIARLNSDISYQFVTDINNPAEGYIGEHEIPVMMEWPDNHEGLSGGHVLYMDGHREWHDYPGEFPMTESTVATLDALATWHHTTAWASKAYTLANDPHLQALCECNMAYLGIAFKTYANVHDLDVYPKLSATPGTLMFNPDGVVPFHLNDLTRLNCPGSSNACMAPVADDHSYVYPGYVLLTDADVVSFAAAYAAEIAGGGDFSGDLPGPVSYGDTIYRVREGVERIISNDGDNPLGDYVGQYEMPVLIEWPDNHGDIRGGNVLYMDGHVEWHDYPGEFPMTEATMAVLTNLAERPPIE